jgi:hypothetical protein
VKTSEKKRDACYNDSAKYEEKLGVRWAKDGPGITETVLVEEKEKEEKDIGE